MVILHKKEVTRNRKLLSIKDYMLHLGKGALYVITDICFCDNLKCKKRKQCARAKENHSKDSLPEYFSMAAFKCFQEGERVYFMKIKKSRK